MDFLQSITLLVEHDQRLSISRGTRDLSRNNFHSPALAPEVDVTFLDDDTTFLGLSLKDVSV